MVQLVPFVLHIAAAAVQTAADEQPVLLLFDVQALGCPTLPFVHDVDDVHAVPPVQPVAP